MEHINYGIAILFGTSIFFTLLFIVRIVENITEATEHDLLLTTYMASISWGFFFYHLYVNWS